MNSILVEIHNACLFFECILEVACFTGLIAIPAIVIGYELQTKRR